MKRIQHIYYFTAIIALLTSPAPAKATSSVTCAKDRAETCQVTVDFDFGGSPKNITGTVRYADGQYAQNVQLSIDCKSNWYSIPLNHRSWSGSVTDTDGYFSLNSMPESCELEFEVYGYKNEGDIQFTCTLPLNVISDQYLEITLPKPYKIQLTVQDESGVAIEGARVSESGNSNSPYRQTVSMGPDISATCYGSTPSGIVTDETGNAIFYSLHLGQTEYSVQYSDSSGIHREIGFTPSLNLQPSNLNVSSLNASGALISWDQPPVSDGSQILNYEIKFSTEPTNGDWWSIGETSQLATSVNLAGRLVPDTRYWVKITPQTADGNGVPLYGNFTTLPLPPEIPTDLTAETGFTNKVNLSWLAPSSDNGDAVSNYLVEYSRDAESWSTFEHESSVFPSISVTGLSPATTYFFRVSAINRGGAGIPSESITATTSAGVPGAPSALSATSIKATSAKLTWTAPPSNGGSTITDYVIQRSTDGGNSWSTVTRSASTARSYSLSGLTKSTTYKYRVSAKNAAGTGPSIEVMFTTPAK